MQLKFGLTLTVLLALLAKGHSELQCYVCDNCEKIDKNTPLQTCGGDTVLATTMMSPSPTTSATTTTEASTTEGTSSSTTTSTTEDPTLPPTKFPTPATVGPISSTTGLPTPPSAGTVVPFEFDLPLNNTTSVNSTSNFTLPTPILFVTPEEPATTLPSLSDVDLSNLTTPSALLVRQRRNIPENGVTYHCFKVQKKYDNVYGTQRGCMGVQTQQSVCGELKAANNNQIQKCKPCSRSKCNGSSTIGVSIVTVLVALLAVFFRA